jgi:hypothetical protein
MQRLIPLLAAVAICLPAQSADHPDARRLERELDSLALPVNAQHIAPVTSYLWFGLPLAARTFDSPGPIDDVVGQLQKIQPLWHNMRGQPGEIVLSGDDGSAQWIARLTPASSGRVDVLLSTMQTPSPAWRPKRSVNSDWVPRTANLRFDLMAIEDRSTQQIWTHTLPSKTLWPILTKALNVKGWTLVGLDRGWSTPTQWTRGDERLDLSLLACRSGAAMLVRRSWEP